MINEKYIEKLRNEVAIEREKALMRIAEGDKKLDKFVKMFFILLIISICLSAFSH